MFTAIIGVAGLVIAALITATVPLLGRLRVHGFYEDRIVRLNLDNQALYEALRACQEREQSAERGADPSESS